MKRKGAPSFLVNPRRVLDITGRPVQGSGGPVVYWCSRDQRVEDNWALLYAQEQARELGAPLLVSFSLVRGFHGATERHYSFMLRGLAEMQRRLERKRIPFRMLRGSPGDTIPELARELQAPLVVTDFSPLRGSRAWRDEVGGRLGEHTALHCVDAHNVVPCFSLDKQEYAARTIRPKLWRAAPEFLEDAFPALEEPSPELGGEAGERIDVQELLEWVGAEKMAPCAEFEPGEEAAAARAARFLTKEGIKGYATKRNDIVLQGVASDLSPYLHYGMISAQRVVQDALALKRKHSALAKDVDSFVEELFIRRELSDNFCYFNEHYDSLEGAASWAKESLELHAADKREWVYTRDQLDKGETHDSLWNAAQRELVVRGKMHGFLRMYWAKKILEWTASPQQALEFGLYLNDRYSLDGRDPNGYVGVAWSVMGIHDQGWKERPVFGKIRYMNYAGCVRKFKKDGIAKYIRYAEKL